MYCTAHFIVKIRCLHVYRNLCDVSKRFIFPRDFLHLNHLNQEIFFKIVYPLFYLLIQAGQVLILHTWRGQKHRDPPLHSIHFSFSMGLLGAPLLARPFLNSENNEELDSNTPRFAVIRGHAQQNVCNTFQTFIAKSLSCSRLPR